MHKEFVNPVRCNVTYSRGYQVRKEIDTRSPYSIALSKQHVFTKDLGPTRTDINLETPRPEIPSHYLSLYLKSSEYWTKYNSKHSPKHASIWYTKGSQTDSKP